MFARRVLLCGLLYIGKYLPVFFDTNYYSPSPEVTREERMKI